MPPPSQLRVKSQSKKRLLNLMVRCLLFEMAVNFMHVNDGRINGSTTSLNNFHDIVLHSTSMIPFPLPFEKFISQIRLNQNDNILNILMHKNHSCVDLVF